MYTAMNGLHNILCHALLAVLFYKNLPEKFSAKGQDMNQATKRSKFAGKIENHQLLADIVENTTVESEFDCMLKCIRRTGCLSFDMSLAGEPPSLWKCYLLSGDYNKHNNLLVTRQGYDHYYFEDEKTLTNIFLNKDEKSNGASHWRITASDPYNSAHNFNWTVDTSGGVDGAHVEVRARTGSQFILHAPGLDPCTGNVSFELAGHPNHYVVAENTYLKINVYEDTEEFKRKATFTRHTLQSKPGLESFMFQGFTVYSNPYGNPSSLQLQYTNLSTMSFGSIYWFKIQ